MKLPTRLARLALRLALPAAVTACGGPSAEVAVHLTATHPHPAAAREVWAARFQSARDHELLAVTGATATLDAPGLVLDVRVRVPRCDDLVADDVKQAVVDLATTQHAFAIHRTRPEAAEALADKIRDSLGADVHTPHDRPGQLVVAASIDRLAPLLPTDGSVVVERAGDPETILWAIDPAPALDGRAVASAGAELDAAQAAVDLDFDDAGAAVMYALSEAELGRCLVLVVDGQFALAPRVMLRVNRALRLDLPPTEAAHALALARAIAASNLPDTPSLVAAEARCVTP